MLSETLLKPAFTDSITFSLCTSKSGGGSYPTQPLLIIKFTTCQMALHKYCVNNSLQAPESPFPVVLTCIRHVDNEVIKFLRNCILLLIPAKCAHCTAATWSLNGSTVKTLSGSPNAMPVGLSYSQWFWPKHAGISLSSMYLFLLYSLCCLPSSAPDAMNLSFQYL